MNLFWLLTLTNVVYGLECIYDNEVQPSTSGVICDCDNTNEDLLVSDFVVKMLTKFFPFTTLNT